MQSGILKPGTLFYRVFHDSPVGMVITTIADGWFVDANEVFARLLGYSRDELLAGGLALFGLHHTAEREMVLDVLRRNRKLGDIPIILHDREQAPRACIASVQLEEIDDEPYFIIMVQDLSEHEKVRRALEESESRFRLFFRSIPLPVLVYDETHRIQDVNPAAGRVYGYTYNEFVALSLSDVMLPEDWESFRQAGPIAEGAPPRSTVCRHRLKDGRIIEANVTSYRPALEGQHITLSVVQDITDRRAMQAALEAGERHMRIVADMTADAIWDRDMLTDGVEWNAGLSTLFGYNWDDDRPHDWWADHVHPDERDAVNQSIDDVLASGESHWTAEYRFLRADGGYANVLDRGRVIRDDRGRPIRFIGAMVDITEQLQVAEVAARAALEERQRLATDLHESVTQSLYSISLMAEAARRRAEAGEEDVTADYIARLGELSIHALRQLRLLVYELRPDVLEQEGLAGALRHRLQAVERRAGIKTQLRDHCHATLPVDLQAELFRVAQESLNFILRHAAAAATTVSLDCSPEAIALEIRHDGAACWEDAPEDPDGAAAIRRRVAALGGELTFSGLPGGESVIRVRVPPAAAARRTARP